MAIIHGIPLQEEVCGYICGYNKGTELRAERHTEGYGHGLRSLRKIRKTGGVRN